MLHTGSDDRLDARFLIDARHDDVFGVWLELSDGHHAEGKRHACRHRHHHAAFGKC